MHFGIWESNQREGPGSGPGPPPFSMKKKTLQKVGVIGGEGFSLDPWHESGSSVLGGSATPGSRVQMPALR